MFKNQVNNLLHALITLFLVSTSSRMHAFNSALVIMLSLGGSTSDAAIRVEAYRGEPFGVGRITIDLPQEEANAPWDDDRFAVVEGNGRLMYPVIDNKPVRRVLRRFLGIESPWRVTFYFMFRGDEPLDLTVYSPSPEHVTVRPEQDSRDRDELLDDWWQATTNRYQQVQREAEYPLIVQNYLTANWARRLGRAMPEPRPHLLPQRNTGGTWIAQLTGNEAYQTAIERDLMLGRFGDGQRASVPLPHPTLPQPLVLPAVTSNVEIEPIASHVPHECFYLRFGNFTNYLWFRDFRNQWQGDLGNMILLRNLERNVSQRLQSQLSIGESRIARVMGPRVIRDVAIIGLDAYLRDGAAMGILFHANNSPLLARNITRQRDAALENSADATQKMIDIGGHEVAYLSTPDGRLRSYYATDGDYHLVATSRRLIERFYESGQGEGALASAPDFLNARVEMPVARDDTIFLFMSTAFFENLASPHYRVELDRRLRSVGEMRTLDLARLAARAEGRTAESVEELIDAELLPSGFGQRSDESQLLETDAGFRDSLRGVPGWFVPIADVPVESITRAEAGRYTDFRYTLDEEVGRFVPVVAALKRLTSEDGEIDRIIADVRVAPFSQTRLAQWADRLGPAEALSVAPIEGDVVAGQIIWSALGQPIHIFGGLRDFHPPLMIREGEVAPQGSMDQYLRGYIGTWPRPLVVLDTLLGRPTSAYDRDGVARNDGLFGLWQRRLDDFFLFSFNRDVLMEVGPQLAMTEAERPAQIRLHVADLSGKQIATAVNGFGYMRDRQTSASGSRFMNSLTSQLQVPPEEARGLAEQLVVGQFVCPLGGEYELVDPLLRNAASHGAQNGENGEQLPTPGARRLWASTATPPENHFLLTTIPADYQMPLLNWFRGMNIEVARHADALTLHAELDMNHLELAPPEEAEGDDEGGWKLPSLGGLFSGWGGSTEGQPTGE